MSKIQETKWVQEELGGILLEEKRLEKRFLKLAEQLSARPGNTINYASRDWAASKAAYRFFDNDKVQADKMLLPHIEQTKSRISAREKIIVVQDTTYFNFSNFKKTKGLGSITKIQGSPVYGLCAHATLALSEKGLPLGLIALEQWAQKTLPRGYEHTKIPITQKASHRWINSLKKTAELCDKGTEIVMVCDREADIYELFEEGLQHNINLIVRLQHNRVIYDECHSGNTTIKEHLQRLKKEGRIVIEVPTGSGNRKRKVKMDVFITDISLQSNPRGVKTARTNGRNDIDLCLVELREVDPKDPEKKLNWVLLTTMPVRNLDEAIETMNYYKKRWQIELFFKTLKSGCNIEECRLDTAEKLMKYIALKSIIGWRLFWITFIGRFCPDFSCELAFTVSEWKTLWLKHHRKEIRLKEIKPIPPEDPPKLKDAIYWLACEGGFLGRKGDNEPGLQTIWRGWFILEESAEVWDLTH